MKKKRKYLGGAWGMPTSPRGMPTSPPPPSPRPNPPNILKVETKICAIWSILEANLKKPSTLKFMMIISSVPSICIHRSIILIFIAKKYAFFYGKCYFPRFSILISARILVSATNSRSENRSGSTSRRPHSSCQAVTAGTVDSSKTKRSKYCVRLSWIWRNPQIFAQRTAYRGFPTRMVYLHYISLEIYHSGRKPSICNWVIVNYPKSQEYGKK